MRISVGIPPGSQKTRRVIQDKPNTAKHTNPARKIPGNKHNSKVETTQDFWKTIKKEPIVDIFDEGDILSIIADGLTATELQDLIPVFGKIVHKAYKNGIAHIKIMREGE